MGTKGSKPRGRPFKPGQSGNPSGKPKDNRPPRHLHADARLLARDACPEAAAILIAIATDQLYRTGDDGKQIRVHVKASERLAAANALFDRGYGHPPQSVAISSDVAAVGLRPGEALEAVEAKLRELGQRERAIRGMRPDEDLPLIEGPEGILH